MSIKAPLNQYNPRAMTQEDWQLSDIQWTVDEAGPKFEGSETPKWLVDSTTGKRYLNESKNIVRFKCLLLAPLQIFQASVIAGPLNIAFRSLKILSGYHFWSEQASEKTYQFTATVGNQSCTFKARFDELGPVNDFFMKKAKVASLSKNEDGTYKFEIKCEQKIITINASTDGWAGLQETITLSDFQEIESKYDVKERFIEVAKDIGRIVASVFVIIPLLASAAYGLWKPYEARKLISSIALAVLGTNEVAACFAPDPSFHLLGGSMDKQHAF
jgi:hypothetical protein